MTMVGPDSYGGRAYDSYMNRYDDSAVTRLKQHYWTAKQAVRSKLGKKEDDLLVASDAELDAKLAVYNALKDTCEDMLRCIEDYQDYICEISQEENSLGRFLKQQGKADKTQAGKMMVAVGRAQSFSAQQRLALRVPLVRLYSEMEVFYEKAVSDCQGTVDRVEKARTEYRGSLLWMKKVSEELDPDTYRQLDKFRRVQAAVRRNKAQFDRHKLDCLQKVDLLAASRCNLFSQLLTNYQNCLLHFWDRASSGHSTVSENFKGYQHFEFVVCKDLAEPSKKLADLTAGNSEEKVENGKEEDIEHELKLISLDDVIDKQAVEAKESDASLEQMFFRDLSPDSEQKEEQGFEKLVELLDRPIPRLPPPPGGVNTPMKSNAVSNPSQEKGEKSQSDLLLDEILAGADSAEAGNSFASEWQTAFGEARGRPAPLATALNPGVDVGPASPAPGGHLPSQLFDSFALSSISTQQSTSSFVPAENSKMTQKKGEVRKESGQKDWFDLFADLDPLQNPDDLGGSQQNSNNPC